MREIAYPPSSRVAPRRPFDAHPTRTPHTHALTCSVPRHAGCFDLLHHGHSNLLESLRQFGSTVIVGIHDDASYLRLKGQIPIDNLETRVHNLGPYADYVFVIEDTDPTAAIQVRARRARE